MDFVFEFILQSILEGIFGLTIKNPKVRTRVKTLVFLLMSGAVAAFLLWISVQSGSIVAIVVVLALSLSFLAMAVDGHKRDWKQE